MQEWLHWKKQLQRRSTAYAARQIQVVVLLAAAVAAIVVFEAVDAATVFDAAVVVVEAIAVAGVAELVENAMRSVLVEIALMTSSSDQIDCLV